MIFAGVDYAQNDYAAYVVAHGLGHKKDAEKYLERSGCVNDISSHPQLVA